MNASLSSNIHPPKHELKLHSSNLKPVPALSSGTSLSGSLGNMGIIDTTRHETRKSYNREYYMKEDYEAPVEDTYYATTYSGYGIGHSPYEHKIYTSELNALPKGKTPPLNKLVELNRHVNRELIKKV